jgi:hypothetical protein
MNAQTLNAVFDTRMSDPAINLLARTTAAMRADPDYFRREDDVASGVFLAGEHPASLAEDALARALARIDDDAALDRRASEQVQGRDARMAELAGLPASVALH